MVKNEKYSSALTGSGFMMYEFKQIISLKLEGLLDKEIRAKVLDDNIFQYKTITGIQRAFPYLLKRVNTLDETLMQMVLDEDIETAKVINLYSIMKADRLFNEFMQEVVKEKVEQPGEVLEKKDINVFFADKAEQVEFINNLAESTVARLKAQYSTILLEAGMLKDLKTREIQRIVMDEQLTRYLIDIGDRLYVEALGENEGIS